MPSLTFLNQVNAKVGTNDNPFTMIDEPFWLKYADIKMTKTSGTGTGAYLCDQYGNPYVFIPYSTALSTQVYNVPYPFDAADLVFRTQTAGDVFTVTAVGTMMTDTELKLGGY